MTILDYRVADALKGRANPLRYAIVACIVGVAGNLLGMAAAATLWSIPPGTPIRPMALAALLLLIAFVTAAAGGLMALIAVIGGWRRPVIWAVAALGVVLSLMPLLTSNLVWNFIVRCHGLIPEP